MLNTDVKNYLDRSVLCWLATCDQNLQPNVSPKEMFRYQDDQTVLIAHIASPVSIRNIRLNPQVCVSFVDVFVQKGYKLIGVASLIYPTDEHFEHKVGPFRLKYGTKFPIRCLIEVKVTRVERILAPNYQLFPETTEESQVTEALRTYGVKRFE